jgi:hypothetical protein
MSTADEDRILVNRILTSLLPFLTDGATTLIGAVYTPRRSVRVYVRRRGDGALAADLHLDGPETNKLWAVWHVVASIRLLAHSPGELVFNSVDDDPIVNRVLDVNSLLSADEALGRGLLVEDTVRHVLNDILRLRPDSEADERLVAQDSFLECFLGFRRIEADRLRLYVRKEGMPVGDCLLGPNSLGFDVRMVDSTGVPRSYPIFVRTQLAALLSEDMVNLLTMLPVSPSDGISALILDASHFV